MSPEKSKAGHSENIKQLNLGIETLFLMLVEGVQCGRRRPPQNSSGMK